jgi:hypothetical protein
VQRHLPADLFHNLEIDRTAVIPIELEEHGRDGTVYVCISQLVI